MGVDITCKVNGKKISIQDLKKTTQRILKLLRQDRAELSLALVGDQEIRKLNARYRKKDQPTDVLSFPLEGDLPAGQKLLGDVVISVEQAEKQARKRGTKLGEEIEDLLIHGILHLLGYDHERSDAEAKAMRKMEKKIRHFVRKRH